MGSEEAREVDTGYKIYYNGNIQYRNGVERVLVKDFKDNVVVVSMKGER